MVLHLFTFVTITKLFLCLEFSLIFKTGTDLTESQVNLFLSCLFKEFSEVYF